jgi:putative membrane protein insertion efficiency factor
MFHARKSRRSLPASLAAPEGSRSFGAQCALVLIRAYQLSLSAVLGRTCRHLPTCSDYGRDAIGRFGLWAGGWMTLARLWRCRPFGSHGFDPAPDALPAGARWYRPWHYGRWSGRHIEHTFANG